MKAQLGRVVFFVRDAALLAEWYRDTFGLTIKYDGLDSGWIELDAGGACSLALHTIHDPEPSSAEIGFVVDDVEATRKQLAAKGVKMHDEVCTWRHYEYCKGRDPQGNTFQIINSD